MTALINGNDRTLADHKDKDRTTMFWNELQYQYLAYLCSYLIQSEHQSIPGKLAMRLIEMVDDTGEDMTIEMAESVIDC